MSIKDKILKNRERTKIRQKKLKQLHLCQDCGKVHVNNKLYCEKCGNKRNKRSKIKRKKYTTLGFCSTGCGRKIFSKTLCKMCLNKLRSKDKSLVKQGLCRNQCGRKARKNATYCKICLWKILLRGYNITNKQVNDILEKQNYVCPLSGRKLIKGKNTSIDHIISIGKNRKNKNHKLNNVENLRFVDIEVQYLRKDMSDKKLLKLCKDIVQHNNRFK